MNAHGLVPASSIRAMGLDELNRFHSESGGTSENLLIGMESISSIAANADTEEKSVNSDVFNLLMMMAPLSKFIAALHQNHLCAEREIRRRNGESGGGVTLGISYWNVLVMLITSLTLWTLYGTSFMTKKIQ